MSHKKIAQQFKSTMKHKYAVGDKVTLTIEAEVTGLLPFSFVDPGYTVRIGKVELVVSEKSLEKLETPDNHPV